jgi:plasmid segregation protein ParM
MRKLSKGKSHRAKLLENPPPPCTLVGLDVGYGYTKYVSPDQKRMILPSLVAPADVHTFSLGLGDHGQTVTIDDVDYVVGEAAVSRGFRFSEEYDGWWTSVRYKALLQYLKSFIPPHSHICSGLPLHVFTAVKAHEQVQDAIRQGLRASRVTLMPQGVGAYCAATTMDESLKMGRIGIVDLGGRTTELVTVCEGNFLPQQSNGLLLGVNTIFQKAAVQLSFETKRAIDSYEFEWAYRHTKPIMITGEPVRQEVLAGLVQPLVAPFLQELFRDMTTLWGAGAPRLDRLIYCGGGAALLQEYLSAFRAHHTVMPDSQFANALGYLTYAQWTTPQTDVASPIPAIQNAHTIEAVQPVA